MTPYKALVGIVVFALVSASLATGARASSPGQLEVTFFAVGQGDSALYRGPCGELGLIDANSAAVAPVVAAVGGRPLKWISTSHYDADHIAGVTGLASRGLVPGTVYDRGGDRDAKNTRTYREYFDYVHSGIVRHVPLTIDDEFSLCDGADKVSFKVHWVGTADPVVDGRPVTEENDRGICLKVEYRDFDLATCGDINGVSEGSRRNVESVVAPRIGDVEVAKVNHHGARYSSNASYVSTLSAQASVASLGANSYGHPHPDVVARWREEGDLFLTNQPDGLPEDGTVTVATTGVRGFSVSTSHSGERKQYPFDENRFSVSDATVTEGDEGSVTATFVISRPLAGSSASVDFHTADGTAQAGSDYASLMGSVVFAPETIEIPVNVTVSGDDEKEPSETLALQITSPDTNLLGDVVGQATIVNDDGFGALDVIAKTGDTVNIGGVSASLTGLGPEPSINDDGTVAFVGRHGGGEGIFVWEDDAVRNINPQFSQNPSRTFGDTVQINNEGMVVGRDRVSGSPPSSRIRVWNSHASNEHTVVAVGGTSNPDNFTAVAGPASLGNNGGVAFVGITPFATNLVTSAPPYEENSLAALHTGLRPMVDDDGRVVVKVTGGSGTGDVLRLYSGNLEPLPSVACAPGAICAHPEFTLIGRAAGTSDDGTLVSFYAVTEPADNTAGVFASVAQPDGTRLLVRAAGVSGNGYLDPGETWDDLDGNGRFDTPSETDRGPFSRFEPHARVAVNQGGGDASTATVVFTGYDTDDKKGLYSARLDLSSLIVEAATPVLRLGDEVDGLSGTVDGFSVFDPLNTGEDQDLVLWAKTSTGLEAILHQRSSVTPLVFIAGAGGSELFDPSGEKLWLRLFEGQRFIGERLNLKDPANQQLAAHDVLREVVPGAQIYGPLLETLKSHGYREYSFLEGGAFRPERRTAAGCDTSQSNERPNLFVFAYDWRKDNASNAEKLKDFMGCVQQFHPEAKVNVLAHSMGGVLARRYIIDNPAQHRVNSLVTMGTPWLGAPKMLFVLESGHFLPFVASGPGVKAAVETMPALHQLLPSRASLALGAPPPLGEAGRDFDGDGRDDEFYDFDKLVDVLNHKHPGFAPGTTGDRFHGHALGSSAQDDWQDDASGVDYYHLFGQEGSETTPEQVVAVRWWTCIIDKVDPTRDCNLPELLRLEFGAGDGTVPTLSASRRGLADFNHRTATVLPVPGEAQGHNGMLRNPDLQRQVLTWLDDEGGPKPPHGATPLSLASAAQKSDTAAALAAPPIPGPSHWLTVVGGRSVVVSDDKGNDTAPVDGTTLRGTVPGVEQFFVGDDAVTVAMPAGEPILTSFETTGEPMLIEVLTSDGSGTVAGAARYLDLELPGGISAVVEATASGVTDLRYDGDGDGTFESSVAPTVSLSGPDAQDRDGPALTITETPAGDSTTVAVLGEDSGAGVNDIYYSLDGSHFAPYTGEVSVNPKDHAVVWVLADDSAGNRSAASHRLTPAPADEPPVAEDVIVGTSEDAPVEVALNGEDPEGAPLTFKTITEPSHGNLSGTGATRTYHPAPDFHGTDHFTYVANDGREDSNVATVTITVAPVNDAPIATDDSLSIVTGTALTLAAPGVLANDRDADGDTLRAELVGRASQGTVDLLPDGSLHYVPAAGFQGTDQFTYLVADGTLKSHLATVVITVAPSNAPDCSRFSPSSGVLWPPNHKLRSITVTGARNTPGGPLAVTITGVEQDELVNGLGDGDQGPDAVFTAVPDEVRLRAERSGDGDGRVYWVLFTATDTTGASCSGAVTVGVPHHQNGPPAVDSSPPRFNSRGV